MASRSLDDLCPEMKEVCEEFLEQCADYKINVLVYCTYRSNEEQDEEYARGRTVNSHIGSSPKRPLGATVTNAKAGQSKHNCMENGKPASRAFDCVPTRQGQPQWKDISAYEKMGEIGRGLGLTWGGDWKHQDKPHFEWKD